MSKILNVSFDIETDGDNPILNNMISIGMVGFDDDLNEIFTYEANIENLPEHQPQTSCMESFWNKPEQTNAWNYIQQNKKNYIQVCTDLSDIFKKYTDKKYGYKIEFVAHPACFDWMFFKSYYSLAKSHDSTLFDIGFGCKCASTLWTLYKKNKNLSSTKATELYNELSDFNPENQHMALADAICQGKVYIKIKKELEIKN